MAKQNVTTPEVEILGEEAISKTEHFFENNGKKITTLIVAIVVVAVAVFGYKSLVVEPRTEAASAMLYKAQLLLESQTPNYQLALEGDATIPGFLEVIEEYGSTPAGNLAKHYAGACYVHLSQWETALTYLKEYKPVKGIAGSIINAQNYALQGDCFTEVDNLTGAVRSYLKAAEVADNALTSPGYLVKAAIASFDISDQETVDNLFARIIKEYPGTDEANRAEKYLEALKHHTGLKSNR